MSGGLMVVVDLFAGMAKGAALAASEIREATEERRQYNAAVSGATSGTSSVPRAAGSAPSTMGAAPSDGVTTDGLAAALQITRGRLR